MTRPIPPHGTSSRYQGAKHSDRWAPCRCAPCRKAGSRMTKTGRVRRARGVPAFSDASKIADHLDLCVARGWAKNEIAEAADVAERTIFGILRRERAGVRHSLARRLLAIDPASPPTLVCAVGSARKLQALAAVGWTVSWSARQAGVDESWALNIAAGRALSVNVRTAAAIDKVFREYAMRPGPSSYARTVARRNGWHSLAVWNDATIDDPAAFPDFTGHCGTPSGWLLHEAWDEDPCEACAGHAIDLKDRPHVRIFVAVYQGAIEALQADGWTWTRIGQFVHAKPDFVRDEYRKHTKDQMGVAA